MDFSKILPIIEAAAPTVAGLLGGPLASMGVQTLEGVFGLSPGSGVDDRGGPSTAMLAAVQGMTPDAAVKLAQVDADLKGKLSDAGISYERIAADDRASARSREESVKDWTPRLLAFCITAGFFALLGVMTWHNIPIANQQMINIVVGSLGAAWLAVINYYFGSSAGSAKKDDTITALTK